MLDLLQDLAVFKNEILAKYTPKQTNLLIYQNQSLYCEFDYDDPEYPEKLVISLNKLDGNIYCYFRDKRRTPEIHDIVPNIIFRNNENVYFYKIKDLSKEKLIQVFIKIIKSADYYFINYCMINSKKKSRINGDYKDRDHNIIKAPKNLFNCSFQFLGSNNGIIIDPEAGLKDVFIEIRGNNNKVHIHKQVSISGHWRLGHNCQLTIGSHSSSTSPVYITCAEGTKVTIGEDCMFATGNQIRTDDSHAIYSVYTGERVNPSKDIEIGNHVWLAYDTIVLGGSKIGSGSIIGSRSLVTNKIPNNCVAVGSPAKVIKSDVFWERPNLLNFNESISFSKSEIQQKPYALPTEN